VTVFLAIPAHSCQVHFATLSSIVQSVFELTAKGTLVHLNCWAGDSLLPHARNALLAKFLTTDCTDLVFVDSDISWEPGALVRLLSHDVDLVAGAYRHKREPESYPVNWLPKDELWADPNTGLLEVADVPMGFTRMRRDAVQKMADAFVGRAYSHHSAPELDCRCLFELEFNAGGFYGEDFVFCRRWRELGGQIWVDPELSVTHHGMADFRGHLGDWLRNR
jgi:hypothetical protein